jgi:RNA polymerase sigma-70 factor (ECF subfamily)
MTENEARFNQIVSDYSEKIYWHVRPMVESHEDADDLVQEIYIKIWKSLDSFRGDSDIYTWIYRIATNETLNFLRKKKVRAFLNFRAAEEEALGKVASDPYFNGTAAENALRREILRLPEKQRIVFSMRYYEEMPYEKMAEILGTSEGALKASYHIASEKIRKYFNNQSFVF